MDDVASVLSKFREDAGDPAGVRLRKMLAIVRAHLGMDVGFVSEFAEGRRVFRLVDAGVETAVVAGASDPLEESYCQRIVDGRLPEIIHDAGATTATAKLPVTRALSIGAYIGVPMRLRDGCVYGTLCCFARQPDRTLGRRDLATLRAFADLMAEIIYGDIEAQRTQDECRARITGTITRSEFTTAYQPIYDLRGNRLTGFEALTHFAAEPHRAPDLWFAEALHAGLGGDLEIAALRQACAGLARLPRGTSLSVNLSPSVITEPGFTALFDGLPADRLILEVTEHAKVADYAALAAALQPMRARGLRLAVDDAGAGHASFRHVLDLNPDIIKLDMSLTRDVDRDPARRALALALTAFGLAIGSEIVAEGVETGAELAALRDIGVTKVQGFLLGRPLSLDEASALPASLTERTD